MSSNEIYTGANQDQTRFFRIEGNKLTIRTPEIASAVRPGQKAVGTITFERERWERDPRFRKPCFLRVKSENRTSLDAV